MPTLYRVRLFRERHPERDALYKAKRRAAVAALRATRLAAETLALPAIREPLALPAIREPLALPAPVETLPIIMPLMPERELVPVFPELNSFAALKKAA